MNRLASAVAVVAVLLSPARARSEEPVPPAATAAQPAPAEATPVVESVPPAAAEAEQPWALYERAFAAAVAGRDDEALSALATLQAQHPHSGPAAMGAELQRQLEARRGQSVGAVDSGLRRALDAGPSGTPPGPSAAGTKRYATLFDALHDEAPSGGARAEFIVFQTLHGLVVGGEICVATSGCGQNVAGILLVPMLAGGAGAFGAVMFSQDGITPGHALAIDSGATWGAWQALALTGITDSWSITATPLLLMASQAAGMGLGHLAWQGLGLSAGDVSLVNTAGIWAGIYTLMTLYVSGASGSASGLFGALLVASDVGLVAGGLLARQFPMSRGRTLLLDAGGILGGLLGLGTYVIAVPNDFGRGTVGAVLAGSLTGMAAAALLSRDWDAPLLGQVQVGVAPTQYGGSQLLVTGRF